MASVVASWAELRGLTSAVAALPKPAVMRKFLRVQDMMVTMLLSATLLVYKSVREWGMSHGQLEED
jgi:hypothetical protein